MPMDDEQESTETSAPPAKAKSGMLLILIIGVLLVVISSAVTFFLVKSMSPKGTPTAIKEPVVVPAETKAPILYDAKEVFVNIASTRSTRILKFKPFLELNEETAKAQLDTMGPMLRDAIATAAGSMTLDELDGPRGKELLKKKVLDAVNQALQGRLSGAVINVHLDDFLIQ